MQIEEAELRDHRKIGKDLKLFHFQDDAPGMVFWHPDGWKTYTELKDTLEKCNQTQLSRNKNASSS